jgi:hypothetical protein
MSAGMAEGYGTRRVQRGQLVCKNCGCVVVMDLARLRATGGGGPSGTNAERRAGVLIGALAFFLASVGFGPGGGFVSLKARKGS